MFTSAVLAAALATSTPFTLGGGSIEVPLSTCGGGTVAVPVTINGKGPYPLVLLLSGPSAIDEDLAAELGLKGKQSGISVLVASGAQVLSRRLDDVSLKVGSAVLPATTVTARSNPDSPRTNTCRGRLGADPLLRYRASVDFRRAVLSLSPSRPDEPRPAESIPITTVAEEIGAAPFIRTTASADGHRLEVNLAVSGWTALWLQLETRSAEPLFQRAAKLTADNWALRGASESELIYLDRIELGGAALMNVRTERELRRLAMNAIAPGGKVNPPSFEGNLYIGPGSNLTIDARAGWIRVEQAEPTTQFCRAERPYRGHGLAIAIQAGSGRVIRVDRGSPGARAGVRPGDRVTSVHGMSVKDYLVSPLYCSPPDVTPIVLAGPNGERRVELRSEVLLP